jgi:hypothetical protein
MSLLAFVGAKAIAVLDHSPDCNQPCFSAGPRTPEDFVWYRQRRLRSPPLYEKRGLAVASRRQAKTLHPHTMWSLVPDEDTLGGRHETRGPTGGEGFRNLSWGPTSAVCGMTSLVSPGGG